MTEYLINEDTLTDIADAIRDKNGTTDPIPANEMAAQIAAISTGINPEDVPEEVYIGTTEPTDENVKIWINPDEPSTPGGGGSSEGGAKVYILSQYGNDTDKAIITELCQYYFNNDHKYPDNVYYVQTGADQIIVDRINITSWSSSDEIKLFFTTSNGDRYSIFAQTNTAHEVTYISLSTESSSSSAKDWHWVDVNSNNFYMDNQLEHIKLVVSFDNGTYGSYDISSYEYLNQMYRTYRIPDYSTEISVTFDLGNVSISHGNIVGYYYWG